MSADNPSNLVFQGGNLFMYPGSNAFPGAFVDLKECGGRPGIELSPGTTPDFGAGILNRHRFTWLKLEALIHRGYAEGTLESKFGIDVDGETAVVEHPEIALPNGAGLSLIVGDDRNQKERVDLRPHTGHENRITCPIVDHGSIGRDATFTLDNCNSEVGVVAGCMVGIGKN